jgi:hypothetical protein
MFIPRIDWDEMMKVRIREITDEQTLHLVIKTLIVQRIYLKHKNNRHLLKIYTEFPVNDSRICDVYYENYKTKEVVCYEIQKEITNEWKESTIRFYNNLEIPYMKSVDLVIVPIKESPQTVDEIKHWLDNLII